MKNKPFLTLTKKQRQQIKAALDNRILGCGLAMFAKSRASTEQAQNLEITFQQGMDKYYEILGALNTLGITIEGHETNNAAA